MVAAGTEQCAVERLATASDFDRDAGVARGYAYEAAHVAGGFLEYHGVPAAVADAWCSLDVTHVRLIVRSSGASPGDAQHRLRAALKATEAHVADYFGNALDVRAVAQLR